MNKLLVVAVLVAVVALSAEGFRMPRQTLPAEEEEEQGTLTKITGALRSGYNGAINTASGYLESIKGLKLEEKAKNLYSETTNIVSTYVGILQDQIYYTINPQQ